MTSRWIIWTLVAMAVIFVAVYVLFFSPKATQAANMRKAEQHIRANMTQITADPRFAGVDIAPFTGADGSLGVFGSVKHKADAEALKKLVDQSKPPVKVVFHVDVEEASTTQPQG